MLETPTLYAPLLGHVDRLSPKLEFHELFELEMFLDLKDSWLF